MRLLRFTCIGAAGFLLDAALLMLLMRGLEWNPYIARLPSFVAVATLTWLANRHWTFREAGSSSWLRQWAQYQLAMLGGMLVNYTVYAALISSWAPSVQYPVIGAACGSLAGLAANYLSAQHLIFATADQTAMATGSDQEDA